MLNHETSDPDRDRVERLLVAHRAALVRYVTGRTHDPSGADDVVQAVALRAMRHAASLRDEAHGRAWLFRITRNVLADELSRKRPLELPVEAAEGLAEVVEDDHACACILTQAKALKPEYATLLDQVVVDGRRITEVAAELGISANNATVRLHRARAALKQRLMDHCGTDSLRACLNCACDERRCCADA